MRVGGTRGAWRIVAAGTLIALGLLVGSRWLTFREEAVVHGDMAAFGVKISPSGQPLALLSPEQVAYHRRLEQIYSRASSQPWRPLPKLPREP